MMFNNSAQVSSIAAKADEPQGIPKSSARRRQSSDACLLDRLPNTAFIEREAGLSLPRAVLQQLRRRSLSSSSAPASPEEETPRKSSATVAKAASNDVKTSTSLRQTKTPYREPEAFEIFRAIEQKDLTYLMEVRDRAFHLLLRRSGGATPLVHAMRLGKSHQEVAVILLGALSRWVNQLDDEEIMQSKTKVMLKALRANLKLAIDHGLQTSQTDLIASFMQTLIMSEGEKWVYNQVSNVRLALRAGSEAKPVHTAESTVRVFATKELGKAPILIASLEDYVANATADLLMMATFSMVLDHVQAPPIPSWYFARDDRVYKAFVDRLDEHKRDIERTASKQTRWYIRVLRFVMEGRSTTYRMKVEALAHEFDEGPGPV